MSRMAKLGADLRREDVDAFNAFCDDRGYLKGRLAEAAIRLIQWMPAELVVLLNQKNEAAVREYFRLVEKEFGASVADVLVRAAKRNAAARKPRQKSAGDSSSAG